MAGAPAVPGAAPPAASADEASAERERERGLGEHLGRVARHLRLQLHAFGELDLALSDLSELGGRCRGLGVGAELLEALDSALLASEDSEGLVCELGLDAGGAAESAALRAEVLACAGDYFALFRCPELAKAQHEAALKEDGGCLAALLGAARAEAELNSAGRVESALRCCRRAAELAVLRGSEFGEDAPQWERRASECFHLLDDAVGLETTPRALEGLPELLALSVPLLATPAASAIESLSRRCLAPAPWLAQPLDAVDAVETPLPDLVSALLLHSEAFCHVTLERHVVRWRAALCGLLHTVLRGDSQEEPGGALRPLAELRPGQVQDAAALACHLHFVGYCVPPADPEATDEMTKLEAARRLNKPRSACGDDGADVRSAAAWLLVSLYESPRVDLPEGLRNYGVVAVSALAARCSAEPREEAALLQTLPVLRPDGSLATGVGVASGKVQQELPDTPCRTFYDETVYPAWHDAVESAGVLPATIDERLARLFPWREARPTSGGTRRVLVAGCGSGHQVAVELRTYSDCQVVALDCAPRSVAYAKRKLRRALRSEEFSRVSFVVGDILELKPGSALAGPGFDLVICCGVLHHLRRPAEGLQRLAGVLAPGGVLQLSTYSRISVESWQAPVRAYLRAAPAAKDLYDGAGQLSRAPTPQEVRAIRQHVLSLPAGAEVRDLLVHFSEFFTYGGVLDLLFHPLETAYTLAELEAGPLRAARLRPLGVFFPNVNADLSARRRFRGAPGAEEDPRMVDLGRWHALELSDPDLFGRMHSLFLEREPGAPPPGAAVHGGAAAEAAPTAAVRDEAPPKRQRT